MADPLKLGRYEIRQTLGRGAMGVVYEGFDPTLNRRVAIKTILQAATGDPDVAKDFAMRFSREARAAARLSHPNIVQVYDFGVENDLSYLVMEFVEGTELSAFFDSNEAFEIEDVTRLMTQLLAALELAHNAGIVHRDIKPANVMVDANGSAKLADFGVARVSDGQDATQVGAMVGTPAYMSPEQVQGQPVDRRTDIFSAGVILYQFLTGQKPFQGGGAYTLARKIIHDEPATPSSLAPSISPAYDRVIARALAKSPDARYQTAKEFSQALERLLRQERPAETPDDDSTRKISAADMPARTETPAPVEPSTTDVELEFWRAIKDSDDIDDLELYVAKFPSGVYSELAQRKVAKLKRSAGAAAEEAAALKRQLEEEARARRDAEAAAQRASEEKARIEAEARAQAQRAAQLKQEAEAQAAARRAAEAAAAAAAWKAAEVPQAPPVVQPQPVAGKSKAIPAVLGVLAIAVAAGAYFAMQPKAPAAVSVPAPAPQPPVAVPAAVQPAAPAAPAPVAEEKKPEPVREVVKAAPAPAPAARAGADAVSKAAASKAAADAAAAKAAADIAAARSSAEQAAAKAAAAAAAAEQRAAAAEQRAAAAEKATAERAAAEKAAADRAAAEKASAERAAADKAAADRAAADKAAVDKAAAERAAADKAKAAGSAAAPRDHFNSVRNWQQQAPPSASAPAPAAAPAAAGKAAADKGDCSTIFARARNMNC